MSEQQFERKDSGTRPISTRQPLANDIVMTQSELNANIRYLKGRIGKLRTLQQSLDVKNLIRDLEADIAKYEIQIARRFPSRDAA